MIVGPSYQINTRKAEVQRTVNLYPVAMEVPGGKSVSYLDSVPGLSVFSVVGVPSPPPASVLILQGEGSEGGTVFTDTSTVGRAVSAIGAATTTAAAMRYGTRGINLTTAGSGLSMALAADLDFAGTDATLQAYLRQDVASGFGSIFDMRGTSASNTSWIVYADFASRSISIYDGPTNNVVLTTAVNSMPTVGTYFHLAVVSNAGTVTVWINGVLATSISYTPPATHATGIRIGINQSGADSWSGAMDAIVFDRSALYTAPFTPPIY